jgi:GTP cyclohydrolase I
MNDHSHSRDGLHDVQDPEYEDFRAAIEVHRRDITDEQLRRFEGYAAEIFQTLGMDVGTPATRDTPKRFIRALIDSTKGYDGDANLLKIFETECRGAPDCSSSQVIEGPIRFYSLCEHHALPFFGEAFVGYIAHEHIIGISKLTRMVRIFARRFSVQERIGQEVADTLDAMLQAHGVAVYLEANHLCTQMRGVEEPAQLTRTSFWRGAYFDDPSLRSEFFVACGLTR